MEAPSTWRRRAPAATFGSFFKLILFPSSPIFELPEVVPPSTVPMLPLKAFLHTPNGGIWVVNVEYRGERVCFSDGWNEFVNLNNIVPCSCVIFTPGSFYSFDFVIFEQSATDLVGRGIDIERVNIVINYDMPDSADTYLHMVGRARRFGTKGLAITFVSSASDSDVLNQVQERFEVDIK